MDADALRKAIETSNFLTRLSFWTLLTAGILVLFRSTRERAALVLGPAFLLCLLGVLTGFILSISSLSCTCGGPMHHVREASEVLIASLVLTVGVTLPPMIIAAVSLPLEIVKKQSRAISALPVALLDVSVLGLAGLSLALLPHP